MQSRITRVNSDNSPVRWLNREASVISAPGRRPPVNVVAGLHPEFPNKLALRPAIAFTKRMGGVQLAEEIGGTVGKDLGIEINEIFLGREFRQNLLQRRLEERRESEEIAALG